MGIVGNLWNKHKEKVAAEEQKKAEEEQLRQEVLNEIQPEIKEMLKQRIRQEELNKINGIEPPKKENKGLKMLSDEFKGANLGNDAQMDKLLGKRNTGVNQSDNMLSNDKISQMVSSRPQNAQGTKDYGKMIGGQSLNTNKDIPGMLGAQHKFRDDHGKVFGKTEDKDFGKLIGRSSKSGDEKIKQMLGRK